MLLFSQLLLAQERTVTGVVRSDDGSTLPGVTITIKGTTSGTSSDVDGKYSLNVSGSEDVLVFSFIGMDTKEVTVGAQSKIDVALGMGVELEEVVVTALGISREKKSLGYATQTVAGDDISRVKDVNFMSSLSGQVAGAQIKNSGTMGGSANVIIRGYKSINGNNQPLYVVNGTPISNEISNSSNQTTGRGGYDYGNAAMDINPDDIESVSILKGAAATALYGARAANGVVVIVTKKGSRKTKGAGVTISSGVTLGQINKNTMPTYQKEYGAGYGRYYGSDTVFTGAILDGYVEEVDTDGDGVLDGLATPMGEDASYGLAFDRADELLSWESIYPELEDTYLKPQPYKAAENDPTSFYETSVMINNSVSVEGGNEKGTYRVGMTDMQQKGVLPNSQLRRDNASINLTYSASDRLSINTDANLIQTRGKGRFGTGYDGANPNQAFRQWWAVSTDIKAQEDAYDQTGLNLTWNPYGFTFDEGTRSQPHYSNNPYFVRFENYESDQRDRVIGAVSATYKINDWLNVMGRVTNDSYDELREERIAIGSVEVPMYYKYTRSYYERNYNLIISANKNFGTDDKFNIDANLGTNIRRQGSIETEAQTNGGLLVPGVYSLSNAANGVIAPTFLSSTNDWKILDRPYERSWNRAVDGYYARASLGYDRFLYLDLSGRYDISSTLPVDNNAFFYPAASMSFIYSELFDADFMDFGKIRFNVAAVGNDAPVQSIGIGYNQNGSLLGSALATARNTNPNPNLLPEKTQTIELGLEHKFFKNRLGADLTFYKSNTLNQIIPARVSSTTGTIYQYINVGNIQNQGIELSLYGSIIKKGDFEWSARANWAANRNKVLELSDDLTTFQLASVQGGITIEAEVGQPYGVIKGTNYVYDEKSGEPIVYPHPFGGMRYAKTASPEVIGNMLPDWNAGLTNTLRYKNFSASALIDIQKGGDFFSLDTWYGYGTGIYDFTAGTNDKGNPVRSDVEDGGGLPIGGVVAATDGDGNYILDENGNLTSDGTKNEEYGYYGNYANSSGWATAPNALHVYDATYVKLRQMSITYSLPAKMIEKYPITGLSISLVARNLAILFKNSPYTDPEAGLSAGNIQGYQSGAYPSVREYGFNVTLKF